jgi:Tol biopolymer transport system component
MYIVPSTGGKPKALLESGTEEGVPTWSSDGKRIAFGDVPPIHGKASGSEAIHILNIADHKVTELPDSRGLFTARWSPDGRLLSAVTIHRARLVLYDFGTKKWRSTKAENVNNPTWSSNGKYIYFDTEGHDLALRRLNVATGYVDQFTSLQAYPNLAWWWSGVAPDNSPLILRNLGSSEIFSLNLDRK